MKKIIIIAGLIIGLAAIIYFFYGETEDNSGSAPTETEPPKNLLLPFKVTDISETSGLVNPLGVVRSEKDLAEIGHSGIDFPLVQGAEIYAVADGEIIRLESAYDDWGGMKVGQLLEGTREGEGWEFLYEHITPAEGIEVGSQLTAGDLIGTKTAPEAFTAHFQYSYVFGNYEFTRDPKCWSSNLNKSAEVKLSDWWDKYRKTDVLVEGWSTVADNDVFMFRGLLDETNYPGGPQMCYPLGTNVNSN